MQRYLEPDPAHTLPSPPLPPSLPNVTGPRDTAQFPELAGDALAAVQHRGSHLQIIAGAGSGKTEVVAQRVVNLLAEQVPAESIVAFTFTEQPEDNLDNRMVGQTLSSILAQLKEQRQIIVTTHNPNIVVGGDAEQVVVLDAPGAGQDLIGSCLPCATSGGELRLTRVAQYASA